MAGRTPPNVHVRADETFFVLKGEGLAHADGESFSIRAGDSLLLPRGRQRHREHGSDAPRHADAHGAERGVRRAIRSGPGSSWTTRNAPSSPDDRRPAGASGHRPTTVTGSRFAEGTALDDDARRRPPRRRQLPPRSAGSFLFSSCEAPWPGIASTVTDAYLSWYARHGYIVVIQDVRGGKPPRASRRVCDRARRRLRHLQGAAASRVVRAQLEATQSPIRARPAPGGRRTAAGPGGDLPAMTPWDTYADMAYEHGAFRLQSALGWAVQLAAERARRRGDATANQGAERRLAQAAAVRGDACTPGAARAPRPR